ncbi:MAG: hypothetical protein MJA27_32395 [Pseudanabaenales cyanobacterium]|nr:hypothetical protein [Pseudanabaenales cyanobacterium]
MIQPLPEKKRQVSSCSRPLHSRPHRPTELSSSPGRVKLLVQASSGNQALVCLGSFLGVASAASITIIGIWLSVKLIVNPEKLYWLEQFLPRPGLELGQTMSQTLEDIEVEIKQAGFTLGQVMLLEPALGVETGSTDWLIPVLATRPYCQTHCAQIVELRVYRPQQVAETGPLLKLLDRISTIGPEEAFVVAPFVGTAFESPASTRKLPLTQLQSLPNGIASGIWFTLQGEWGRGNTNVLYGQLIRYNPRKARLSPLLVWTSPAGRQPYWQELDGDQPAELMVDQTVGLQPRFRAYRLEQSSSPVAPLRLRPISFLEPALNQSLAQSTYGKALLLARNGLWSAALRSLQPLKQQSDQNWTAAAEAQLQLIKQHAEITKAQADRTWASPSQQILAYLIDGQWENALELFEAEPDVHTNVLNLLKTDSDRLWNQVSTALRINSNQPAAQAWGALILTAQHNPSTALGWLARQPNSTAIGQRFRTLITPFAVPEPVFASVPALPTKPKRIIGSAIRLRSLDPTAWLSPNSSQFFPSPEQEASDQKAWYRIQVSAFHDGRQWRRTPFSDMPPLSQTADSLWRQLGFDPHPILEILAQSEAGRNQSVQVTVKALQLQGDSLWLLASGKTALELNPTASPLLATTPRTLRQLTSTSAITLARFNQQHSNWVTQITSTFQQMTPWGDGWGVLINSEPEAGTVAQGRINALSALPIQLIDLTGDRQPEALLTLNPAKLEGILGTVSEFPDNYFPRTLIFSETGALIYTDLASSRSLVALASLSPEEPTALVIQESGQFHLWEWSATAQRFQP